MHVYRKYHSSAKICLIPVQLLHIPVILTSKSIIIGCTAQVQGSGRDRTDWLKVIEGQQRLASEVDGTPAGMFMHACAAAS